ncbi:MAG: right-handed parallel beta-helix repeat-containing protein [Candidatus Hydrogenedentes bacterium]|nr:right-handed parallel beta-helix repeat-containing protein [Candidatus Hydrogenedentota bacterium]
MTLAGRYTMPMAAILITLAVDAATQHAHRNPPVALAPHVQALERGAAPSRAKAASPADYYVRPGGGDSHTGLAPEEAWQSFANVNAGAFGPGDRILLEGGAVFTQGLSFGASSVGLAESPIVVTSFGAGRAKIAPPSGSAITVYNTGGFEFRNLELAGPGRTNAGAHEGVHLLADDANGAKFRHVVLKDLDIHGFFRNGVHVQSWHASDPGFEGIRIEDCQVHDNGLNGIFSWGVFRSGATAHYAHRDIQIRGCRVYSNPGQPNWPSHSGSGIQLSFVDGALIEFCEAYENGALNDACGGPVGIWAWEANGVVIQHCEAHHNRSRSGCDGGGFDLDGGVTNSVMQYNYSHDNVGAGFGLFQFEEAHPYANNVVRYNITQNEGMAGIHFWSANSNGGIRGTLVHNNTVFVGPQQAAGIADLDIGASYIYNTRLYNNLIVSHSGRALVDLPHPGDAWDFRGNAYYDSTGAARFRWSGTDYMGLAAWRAASGQEDGTGLEVDPKLCAPGAGGTIASLHGLAQLHAYRLMEDSPLIGAALDLQTQFGVNPGPRDFYGAIVPAFGGADIGAHEYGMVDVCRCPENGPSR